jgi:hypothetical protein
MAFNNSQPMVAGGQIAPCTFVKVDTTADNQCLQAGANDRIIGVAQEGQRYTPGLPGGQQMVAATTGENLGVFGLGNGCMLFAGSGGFTRGDWLESDANGFGVTSSTSGHYIGAIALESAASGVKGLVEVVICKF